MQRGRSASPSRMRGRSSSPSRMMGRSASGEGLVRGKSSSPSRMRGRSSSPSRMRGRSNSPSRMRGRSNSPSTNVRGRSSSPSRMRGRSNSPSRQVRGRSASPSRMRGRSTSPNGTPRSKSTSPADPRKKKRRGFRRGGKRRTPKEGGGDRRRRFSIKPKSIYKSVRHIAPREECPLSKVCSYFVPIVILLASIVGLIVATGNASRFTPDFIEGLIPTFDNKDVVDPFSQKSDGSPSVGKWDTGGESGLTIEVLNAMSASWEVFFNLATADWEYGNPDALTLKIAKVSEDKDCTPVEGKIKVCNGDYGETKWRGINSVDFKPDGSILYSAAQMNEYYLKLDVDDAKQYTICHEIGHAFGLAHTDEEFGNEDLGNCLDYTDNFEVNKHPDVSNYETLLEMYGAAGGRRLMGPWLRWSPTSQGEERSESLKKKIRDTVDKLAARLDDNAHEDGWKLLHRSKHGEEHEMVFEDGHKVRVHMLLA